MLLYNNATTMTRFQRPVRLDSKDLPSAFEGVRNVKAHDNLLQMNKVVNASKKDILALKVVWTTSTNS